MKFAQKVTLEKLAKDIVDELERTEPEDPVDCVFGLLEQHAETQLPTREGKRCGVCGAAWVDGS